MQKEELFLKAHESTDKAERGQLLGDFYTANLGLIVSITLEYTTERNRFEDLLQIAYIALDNACTSYDSCKSYSPLSYFRMCIKHEYYKDWSKQRFSANFYEENEEDMNYTIFDYTPVAEVRMMKMQLWETVWNILPHKDASAVIQRFRYGATLARIGQRLGISAEGARCVINRSLTVLKDSTDVQEIAEFFGYR